MTHNQKPVGLTLKRIELCDLLIACGAARRLSGAEKWHELHDKIAAILDQFDAEYPPETE